LAFAGSEASSAGPPTDARFHTWDGSGVMYVNWFRNMNCGLNGLVSVNVTVVGSVATALLMLSGK